MNLSRELEIPSVLANKAGWMKTRIPGTIIRVKAPFLGRSAIVDGNGEVIKRLQVEEGVIVDEVKLGEMRTNARPPATYGNWSIPMPYFLGKISEGIPKLSSIRYNMSRKRKAKARNL